MKPIDIQTLFYFFTIASFFILIYFTSHVIAYRINKPIISIYIASKVFMCIALLIFSFAAILPAWSKFLIAGPLLAFSSIYEIYCIGMFRYEYKKTHLYFINGIPILVMLVFVFFTGLGEAIRIMVSSFLMALYFFGGGIFILKRKRVNAMQKIIASSYIVISVLMISRGLIIFFSDKSTNILTPLNIQTITYIVWFLVSFITAILLLLLLKEVDIEIIGIDNRKLKEQFNSKKKFLSIIAHDLKSPLGGLYQLGELLDSEEEEIDDAKKKELIRAIHHSAKRTFHLSENLLKWSAANSDILVYSPKLTPINLVVELSIDIYKSVADLKSISITNKVEKELEVYVDQEMIYTVLRNLISNAIKFTKTGGEITIVSSSENAEFVKISVKDNGIGIKEEEVANILKLDSTFSSLGTNDEMGYGLGLKLCREFVEKNKGVIGVESTAGKGSQFWFTLPVERGSL